MKNIVGAIPLIAALIFGVCPVLNAQNVADSLRRAYDFDGAMEACEEAMEACADTLEYAEWETSLMLAMNGKNMTEYCYKPSVVAKVRVPAEDFFLFYPMENNRWIPIPNALDSSYVDDFIGATFIPSSEDEIYFSAMDENRRRNIYQTHYIDSLWSFPVKVDQSLSSSDEIYPVLSQDGRTLYFSSNGLYGMGGYDLYASVWDDDSQSWGVPENLGFPFSSPYDDFLYFDTADGKYTIFASNRGTTRDSVYIYTLEFDSTPIRRSIEDIGELRALANLDPTGSTKIDNTSAVGRFVTQNDDVTRYTMQAELVKAMRDTLYRFHDSIDILELQARLNEAVKTLQKIELEFLSSGLSLDLNSLQKESRRNVVGASSGYALSKNEIGEQISFEFADPVIEEEEEETPAAKPKTTVRKTKSSKVKEITVYYVQIFPEDGRAMPSAAISSIRQATSKDIVRHSEGGVIFFTIGTFESKDDAESLVSTLKETGAPNCSVIDEVVTL